MSDRPNKMVDGKLVPLTDAEWQDYQVRLNAPAPPPPPPVPTVFAMADLHVDADNFDVTGIETSVGLGFALYVGTGTYWLFFNQPQPDADYLAIPGSNAFAANVSDKTLDYVEITVTGTDGAPADPASISIAIYRRAM